jgi:hypothetical protein
VRSPKGVRFKIRMQLAAKRGISKAQIGVCVLLSDYNLGTLRWNICQSQVSFGLYGYIFVLVLKKTHRFYFVISLMLLLFRKSVKKCHSYNYFQ